MKFLFLLVVLGLIVAAAAAIFGRMARPRTNELISAEELTALRKRDSIAQNALLTIAGNMTDNPVLDAQVALSERARTYEIKEIK